MVCIVLCYKSLKIYYNYNEGKSEETSWLYSVHYPLLLQVNNVLGTAIIIYTMWRPFQQAALYELKINFIDHH